MGLARWPARRGRWLSLVSIACILGWAVPALLMLDRGFAVEDEGTYVLAYRFWDSNPYFVAGAQYFYGPVFEAVGESIPLLRLLRLVMVVGSNAFFAWSFVTWLSEERDGVLPTSRGSLLLLLTASGGMSYLWAPLTPGYYDLAADASLTAVSLLLLTLNRAPRVPAAIPLGAGLVAVVLVVTKWTALPVVVLTVGTAYWALLRRERRAAVRYAVLVMSGAAAGLVLCQLFLIPLGRFSTVMWKVTRLNAVGNHGLMYLVRDNISSTLQQLVGCLALSSLLVIGTLRARALARRAHDAQARAWLAGVTFVSAAVLPFALGWHGGGHRGRVVVGIALAGLVVATLAAVLSRRNPLPGSVDGRIVVWVLLLVPFAQAAGTNVVLPYVAVECLAAWVALVLLIAADTDSFPIGSTAVLANLGVTVVATAMIAGSTTLISPFRTTGFEADTTGVANLGLRVSPGAAREFNALRRALDPYVVPQRTPVITLDQKAGLTYLLDGLPVGSTFTSAASPTRTSGILELACDRGDVPTDRKPVLIVDRPIDSELARVMRGCGFGDVGSYRRLIVPGGPSGLTVLVPPS
jgi:hypothetical protein